MAVASKSMRMCVLVVLRTGLACMRGLPFLIGRARKSIISILSQLSEERKASQNAHLAMLGWLMIEMKINWC
ncbi:Cytochrome P450 85A [Spatholobus suberectus]|nr:Cytochrome P450 85A [Spatholobus suberectus]